MAIELSEYVTPAKTVRSGTDPTITVVYGQGLKIETSPGGGEVLDLVCPSDEAWVARIIVEIEVTSV